MKAIALYHFCLSFRKSSRGFCTPMYRHFCLPATVQVSQGTLNDCPSRPRYTQLSVAANSKLSTNAVLLDMSKAGLLYKLTQFPLNPSTVHFCWVILTITRLG